MHQSARVIRLEIRQESPTLWVATSTDEPTFYVSEGTEQALLDAIPLVLEWLYRHKDQDVVVFAAERDDDEDEPYAAIVPRELIAQRALAGC